MDEIVVMSAQGKWIHPRPPLRNWGESFRSNLNKFQLSLKNEKQNDPSESQSIFNQLAINTSAIKTINTVKRGCQ
jgi:hypothetical protein